MFSLLDLIFLNAAFTIAIFSFIINIFERYMPASVLQTFTYGKFSYQGRPVNALKTLEMPKSYFRHFYLVATFLSAYALYVSISLYFLKVSVPDWLIVMLDFLCGSDRRPTVSIATTMITLTLMFIQCCRRFYETFFVQVFAKTSKINLTHYIIGHVHYFGCIVTILSRSSGFTNTSVSTKPNMIDTHTLIFALPTIIIFSLAWINQFKSNIILANLRKDEKTNKVVSQKYFLPTGGLFKYVSCPHQMCEIIIYLSLTMLLYKNTSWLYIVAWVLTNQTETALLSHWWYQKTFPKLPKERKALIPFIL